MRIIDRTGQRFGKLTAVRLVGKNKSNRAIWELVCDCGTLVTRYNLGDDLSCGCSTSIEQRFWDKVRKGDGCWEWTAALDGRGYGELRADGRTRRAHRLSWEIHNGPINGELFVCHHCDNRRCVRPDHLFLGTSKDNVRDMFLKGRARRNGAKGSRHPMAKLNENTVAAIRRRHAAGERTAALAREYGVSQTTVQFAISRRCWSHVA